MLKRRYAILKPVVFNPKSDKNLSMQV